MSQKDRTISSAEGVLKDLKILLEEEKKQQRKRILNAQRKIIQENIDAKANAIMELIQTVPYSVVLDEFPVSVHLFEKGPLEEIVQELQEQGWTDITWETTEDGCELSFSASF